MDVFDTTHY